MKLFTSLLFASLFLLGFAVPVEGNDVEPLQYISPRPGAKYVSPATTIAIRHGARFDRASIPARLFYVTGAQSGVHGGDVVVASDEKTLIFEPDRLFAPGETVSVTVDAGLRTVSGAAVAPFSYQFTISQGNGVAPALATQQATPDLLSVPVSAHATNAASPSPYVTTPVDFPVIETTLRGADSGAGYIFLGATGRNRDMTTVPYLLILDEVGEPVFYRRMTEGRPVLDFKKQPNGLLTYFDTADLAFHALDSTYTLVDTYRAGNGYAPETDVHELLLLPNDHFVLMIYDFEQIDMSEIVPNGVPTATVVGLIIQELDGDRNVVFEWRSWDHFGFADSMYPLDTPLVDPVHGNSIEIDHDGHLLISSRSMDEITKINRQTGNLIWRFGGKNNHFTLINDDQFFHAQHDARRLPNGNLTLFDNRTDLLPRYSRVVEYELDEVAMTATLVWEHRNTPDIYSAFLGNAQRLDNGNTVIGWGPGKPTMTEVTADGAQVIEVTLANRVTYRAFRFPWQGAPPWPPALTSRREEGRTVLYYSWNGATNVSRYNIYAGNTPDAKQLVHGTARDGFETSTDITEFLGSYCFFRIVPFTAGGQALTPSEVIRVVGCQGQFLPFISAP